MSEEQALPKKHHRRSIPISQNDLSELNLSLDKVTISSSSEKTTLDSTEIRKSYFSSQDIGVNEGKELKKFTTKHPPSNVKIAPQKATKHATKHRRKGSFRDLFEPEGVYKGPSITK